MKTTLKLMPLLCAILITGCQTTSENYTSSSPSNIKYKALPLIKTQGNQWLDENDNKVTLRGINLGNWLAMEMWMFGHEEPMGKGITDQCKLEDKLTARFGENKKDQLLDVYRDSWMTSADWDVIADAGFNLVRIPFLYDLIENKDKPMTLRDDAWQRLDWAIAQANARNMYVILDLHGAAGRQGWEQHSGCAGQNELWDSQDNQDRTAWLWKQIATKYKTETTVAAFGLLNEPWGTDKETLKQVSIDLYHALREVDSQHVIILPDHNSGGISAYGIPSDDGLKNVAFEHHAYPGMFGWGEIGYEVNRDWLTCGKDGESGVCEWDKQLQQAQAPILIGETQPWTGLGEMGGENTRATFDRYKELNWAVTAWSYKNTTLAGGISNGQWGLVTNAGGNQLLTKAQTWTCNDWESTFLSACDNKARSVIPFAGTGKQTMYLVIKTGAFNGSDITYDDIKLINDSTGENILINGGFENGDANWTEVAVWGDPRNYDFNYQPGSFAGSDSGKALRVTSVAGNNSLIYQAVEVEGDVAYTLSGKSKDNGENANDMWSEVYLVADKPKLWEDINGRVLAEADINSSSYDDIKTFFASFATMDYEVNQWVIDALTRKEPSTLYTTMPTMPTELSVIASDDQTALSWVASQGEVSGYKVYRSQSKLFGFKEIAVTKETNFVDTNIETQNTYYYYVFAYNAIDQSFQSDIKASGENSVYLLPGRVEAENYSLAHPDVNVETAQDSQGGAMNVGNFEVDRYVEYEVEIEQAGDYIASYRLASLHGSDGFQVLSDGKLLSNVNVPATNGWQEYQTISNQVSLEKGKVTIRLNSVGNQWNLNWFEFKRK